MAPSKVTYEELRKKEKTAITDQFFTTNCIRCNDPSHSCLICPNAASNYATGPYGWLGDGKKMGADKHINDLKATYQRNPADKIFSQALKNRRAQLAALIGSSASNSTPAPASSVGLDSPQVSMTDETTMPTSTDTSAFTKTPARSKDSLQIDAFDNAGEATDTQDEQYEQEGNYPDLRRTVVDSHQPTSVPPPSSQDLARPPNIAQPSTLQHLDHNQLDFPKREHVFPNEHSHVFTNHFEVQISKDLILHRYTILSNFSALSKGKVKDIVKTAIQESEYLFNYQASFATDYFDTIIAWTDLHSRIPLERTELQTNNIAPGTEWKLISLQDGATPRHLRLRYEGTVNIPSIIEYPNAIDTCARDIQDPTRAALNILISKCFEESTTNTFKVGANKYYLKNSYRPLVGTPPQICRSLETSRGFDYQMKPGVGKILLNLQTRTSASYRPVLLSQLMIDRQTFSGIRSELRAILAGLWVRIEYKRGDPNDTETYTRLNSEEARVKKICDLGDPLRAQNFSLNGTNVNVRDYIHNSRNVTLQHPELWAVNLGSRQDPKWYAPEELQIMPYQLHKDLLRPIWTAAMINTACIKPYENAALIEVSGMEALGFAPNAVGMSALVSARWNTKGKQFLRRNWKDIGVQLLMDQGVADPTLARRCFEQFRDFAGRPTGDHKNYSVAKMIQIGPAVTLDPTNREAMTAVMAAAQRNTDLFLMVLANRDQDAYANFKDLADRKFGKHSLCVTEAKFRSKLGEKMGNLMLKANLKTGGINHTIHGGQIQRMFGDTLVLGADVTHPGPTAIVGCPSIAAIVGSVDELAGRFLGSMRLQSQGKKEMIDEVESMVTERIIDWCGEQQAAKRQPGQCLLPMNIIYYRDGVSDDQFKQVKEEELPYIRQAFLAAVEQLKLDRKIPADSNPPLPKITAIICVKRHSVRFYPDDKAGGADKTGNCHPGTLVDDVVTSPFYMDFYLQSHAAIQGTAKPAHYFVIENEMKLSELRIRQLTHELCYTYVRSTSGVSYASPAYYADRLCERGRCYLRDFFVRTTAGRPRRNDIERKQNQQQDALRHKRVKRYGPERDPNTGRKRRVTGSEQEQIQTDRNSLRDFCNGWTMNEAELALYGVADSKPNGDLIPNSPRNPWGNQPLGRTMFWM
ncbi:uncharacterized protein N0V89_007029 [Didymosphaeria variabile]|uniref:Piwi domain-containing protein n=1 Tax=Didymosphaeria variabile TaxID=1932322 RepID=A0A9W9CAF9_9PLEO|nr:uncharacterized protein N0V89_007029 [Didymosphaeria variabile]KAJ4351686.1 hypothetical protein N0V89_007029 [Didymosphaeria variabile]